MYTLKENLVWEMLSGKKGLGFLGIPCVDWLLKKVSRSRQNYGFLILGAWYDFDVIINSTDNLYRSKIMSIS